MTPTPPREASFEEALSEHCQVLLPPDTSCYRCDKARAAHARALAAARIDELRRAMTGNGYQRIERLRLLEKEQRAAAAEKQGR